MSRIINWDNLKQRNKTRRVFSFGYGLFLCCLLSFSIAPSSAQIKKDSLEKSAKEILNRVNGQDAVYKDSSYFSNIPVARAKDSANQFAIHQSFAQMDKRYQSPDFNYETDKKDRLSWWDRLKQNVMAFLISIIPDLNINLKKALYYFLILIGVVVLAYAIYQLILNGKRPLYKEDDKNEKKSADWIEKNLLEIDLKNYLEKALKNHDLRLAIRYLHLINLKALAESGKVEWDAQKTNHDFLLELKEEGTKDKFSTTIFIYEHVWYGGFEITEKNFREYQTLFTDFKAQIKSKRTALMP